MNKVTLGDRLRYEFDNFLSRGTAAMVAALFTVTACLILSTAAILIAISLRSGASQGLLNFPDAVWLTATRMLDPGVVADDSGWSFRLVGLLVTLCGVLLSSALIGILVNGLDQSFDKLRRGRTRVVEAGHTLILGWSPHIYTILHELACANNSRRFNRRVKPDGQERKQSACVVILADQDRLEMEEEIRLRVPTKMGTRIVCRSGDPLDPDVLKIVSPETARAIIILSPGGEHPDLPVGKALVALALARSDMHQQEMHIVTTVQRPENIPVMRMIGGEWAQIFLADRMLGYLMAQACLQPGLGLVFSQLLRFDGANIHLAAMPELTGDTYGNALHRLENAALIGLQSVENGVCLNPPMDTMIQPTDRLILIHKNDVLLRISAHAQDKANGQAILPIPPEPAVPQRLLILGWNQRAPLILEHLKANPGLQVKVFAPVPAGQMQASGLGAGYGSMQLTFEEGNPMDRPSLEKLVAEDYLYILLLSSAGQPSNEAQLVDVSTVVSYLHLRDIGRRTGRCYSILSEIMSERKGDLAVVSTPTDTTISNNLVALVLAQIAENKEIGPVLADLLWPGGSHIVLNPAGNYVMPGVNANFQMVVAAARCRGETAIGYRLLSEAGQAGGFSGVHLNPEKSTRIAFQEQDRVIVVANAHESRETTFSVESSKGK